MADKPKKKSSSGGSGRGDGPRLTKEPIVSVPKSGPAAVSPRKEPAKRAPAKRSSSVRKKRKKNDTPFWLRRSVWRWLLTLALLGAIALFFVILYFAQGLPSINGLETIKKQPGITMKTEDGLIIGSYGDIYGDYVDYDALPKSLVQAVLATEDRRFFQHHGIDIVGIMRAMAVNIRAGGFVQGGSTITQQVAKNVFLTPDRTIRRKIQEMLLAFWLESRFTKKQLFAIYVNRVYLGAGNYGVDAASRRYFDKPATELKRVESAVLAGLLKAPSKYSPIASPERAKKRAHQVLVNMEDAGYINEKEVKTSLAEFQPPKLYREDDPSGTRYFTDWLMDEIPNYVGNVEQDMTVITTLNPTLQKEAEDALKKIMDENGVEKKASQAALVTMEPSGAIRAMVGGRSYPESQFNRAVQAKRQPGSVFKLFVYLAAMDAGMSPDTLVMDEPVEFRVGNTTWRPQNFDGKYRGEITIREALTHSLNTVAVQLTMWVGVERVAEMARRLGIPGVKPNPSIALGAVDANLLDLTGAYAHLANEGKGVRPYGIKEIYAQGEKEPLYKHSDADVWVVLRNSVVQKMNNMLMNVPLAGTGTRAYIGRPMAGKTGTSSDHKDAWFIGFTPQLVTGVWVGNDNNSLMNKVTGGNLPAMIWHDFMLKAMEKEPVRGIPNDASATDSGGLPWQDSPRSLDEMFDRIEEEASDEDTNGQRGPNLNDSFWDTLFGDKPQPEAEPQPQPEPAQQLKPAAEPKPQPQPQEPEERGLFDRLGDEMEYSYPNSSGRERRLSR